MGHLALEPDPGTPLNLHPIRIQNTVLLDIICVLYRKRPVKRISLLFLWNILGNRGFVVSFFLVAWIRFFFISNKSVGHYGDCGWAAVTDVFSQSRPAMYSLNQRVLTNL